MKNKKVKNYNGRLYNIYFRRKTPKKPGFNDILDYQ